MTQTKPAIVLVPGFFSVGTEVYKPLVVQLKSIGFTTVEALNLPSVDTIANKASIKPTSFDADIAVIRATVQQLIEQGKDVLLVAHSYGGTIALCASEGLWKGSNDAHGVLQVCLLSSSLSLPGESVNSARAEWGEKHPGQIPEYSFAKVEQIDEDIFVLPEGFEKDWFADFGPEEFEKWSATLRPSALNSTATPVPATVTPSAWKVSAIITSGNDPTTPLEFQRYLVTRGKAAGVQVKQVKEIDTSHFVQITHPKEVAEWIANQCESL